MNASDANEIERQFAQLPASVQLDVLERLVHQMREKLPTGLEEWESSLEKMAADQEIQQELHRENEEFLVAEGDGLRQV